MAKNQRLTKTNDRGYKNMPDTHIPLHASFTGDIDTRGGIRIDGSVKGNVRAGGNIDIGPEGFVEGEVTGKDIHVAGRIVGNVNSESMIQLLSGATLTGDLKAVSSSIEKGSYFKGKCIIDEQPVKAGLEPAASAEIKAEAKLNGSQK